MVEDGTGPKDVGVRVSISSMFTIVWRLCRFPRRQNCVFQRLCIVLTTYVGVMGIRGIYNGRASRRFLPRRVISIFRALPSAIRDLLAYLGVVKEGFRSQVLRRQRVTSGAMVAAGYGQNGRHVQGTRRSAIGVVKVQRIQRGYHVKRGRVVPYSSIVTNVLGYRARVSSTTGGVSCSSYVPWNVGFLRYVNRGGPVRIHVFRFSFVSYRGGRGPQVIGVPPQVVWRRGSECPMVLRRGWGAWEV